MVKTRIWIEDGRRVYRWTAIADSVSAVSVIRGWPRPEKDRKIKEINGP